MAEVVGVLASRGTSSSIHNGNTPSAEPPPHAQTAQVQSAHTHVHSASTRVDVVYVSRASTLLSEVERQLKQTPATSVNQVLSNAATDILAQAQVENDPHQAKVLENLATRLQVAASSGSSGLPPYSLASLLG